MHLPISEHYKSIVETVHANQVTIVVGETGSGKTTQLPQFLYAANFHNKGVIGVTEPRRIAATSVAHFVADELGTQMGEIVGYQVRYDRRDRYDTAIKFVTDGILLREMQADPDLRNYAVIMIDEAHERSANIDFLLGLLKGLLQRRSDLKLVVSSATIDAGKFSSYFGGAPVIEISGRTYPVEIHWSDRNFTARELPETIAEKIRQIHRQGDDGDVLVFMTGAEDINATVKAIEKLLLLNVVVLPAHGGLAPADQQKLFKQYPGKRKVVVATNIAETSITVEGVVYVVDTGLIKQTHFHPDTGIQSLDVVHHSQAGCEQRAGRSGRTQPGICYRLYTREGFENRPRFTEPELKRMSLAGIVLLMEDIGIENIEGFDFIDPPDPKAFHEAYETLIALGAVKKGRAGLTTLGREMARLPVEPRIARMVLEADKHGCVEAVVTVAAFLSVRNVFVRPKDHEDEADAAHYRFLNRKSDALTFLTIWSNYESSGFDRQWCYENFLHSRTLWEVRKIREQLLEILARQGVTISESTDEQVVLRSITAGLIHNLFVHASRYSYDGVARRELRDVFIHPGSSVFGGFSNPRWMVASEVVLTSKLFARKCSSVEAGLLPELLPERFKFGETRLVSYTPGEDTVTAVRDVIQTGTMDHNIGQHEVRVSLEAARKLQDQLIKKAERESWVLLKVREHENGYDRLAVGDGMICKISIVSRLRPDEGEMVYCAIEQSRWDGHRADPKFKVLDLGSVEPEVQDEQSAVVPEDSLKALVEKFSAGKR